MPQNTPKQKIRDSVFTNMFQEKKYLLQLYKALHPEDTDVTEDAIEDITIKHILIDADYNDLGFSVGNRLMILVESQSTWTCNIIIRALMYMVQTYHEYFKRTGQNLYGSKKVNMPKPELYMIYTGERKNIPDVITLSEEFFAGENISLEAAVKVLHQEDDTNIIGQYIIFCKVYTEQRKLHRATETAVTETIRICKDRNVLKEYLESREQEVIDMMMTLFDEDEIMKAYTRDIEENAERKGERKAERKTAIQMIQKGKLSLEEIAEYVPSLSMEELKALEMEVMQAV